jgi:hypothetical protein
MNLGCLGFLAVEYDREVLLEGSFFGRCGDVWDGVDGKFFAYLLPILNITK